MKTSNKLLLALIVLIMLIATLTMGIAKYHFDSTIEKAGQSQMEQPSAGSLSMGETETKNILHFPVAFILMPRLQW